MINRRKAILSVVSIILIRPNLSKAGNTSTCPKNTNGVHSWGSWGSWSKAEVFGGRCTYWRIRNCTACNTSDSKVKSVRCDSPPSDCD